MSFSSLLDPNILIDMRMNMSLEDFWAAVTLYVANLDDRLARIKVAISENNYAALEAEAHDLKSTMGTFGARAGAEFATTLLEAARRRDGASCAAILPALERTAKAGMAALMQWLDDLPQDQRYR